MELSRELARALPLPEEVRHAFIDFQSLRIVFYGLTGIILWDFCSSLRYEWQVMTRKVPRSWPLLVYFASRYSSILFVGGVLPQAGSAIHIDCGIVWNVVLLAITFQKAFGQALFMIRACAIWGWKRVVVVGLSLVWVGHATIALCNLGLLTLEWTPDPSIAGYGYCTTGYWPWSVGASYICSLLTDLIIIGISAFRLAKMRRVARTGFWVVLFNDGISWSFFTLPPTIAAVFAFFLGKTVPAQCIAMVVSSTMHAIFACRAYRNLSDFADTLPLSFCARDRVRDGTMLDQETLSRLFWFTRANESEDSVVSPHSNTLPWSTPSNVPSVRAPWCRQDSATEAPSAEKLDLQSQISVTSGQLSSSHSRVKEGPPAYRSGRMPLCTSHRQPIVPQMGREQQQQIARRESQLNPATDERVCSIHSNGGVHLPQVQFARQTSRRLNDDLIPSATSPTSTPCHSQGQKPGFDPTTNGWYTPLPAAIFSGIVAPSTLHPARRDFPLETFSSAEPSPMTTIICPVHRSNSVPSAQDGGICGSKNHNSSSSSSNVVYVSSPTRAATDLRISSNTITRSTREASAAVSVPRQPGVGLPWQHSQDHLQRQ